MHGQICYCITEFFFTFHLVISGQISNLHMMISPSSLLHGDSRPTHPITQFKRHLYTPGTSEDGETRDRGQVIVRLHGAGVDEVSHMLIQNILSDPT